MQSELINKTYKVTIEFDITLDQVRECGDINYEHMKELVQESVESQKLIQDAADHIGYEVLGAHEEDGAFFPDYVDFTVSNYKIKTIKG